MNIQEFQNVLESVKVEELYLTKHFKDRAIQRKLHEFANVDHVHQILTTEVPEGIVNQGNDKFQIIYNHNDKYDAIFICSLKNRNPLKISMVTLIKQETSRRVK